MPPFIVRLFFSLGFLGEFKAYFLFFLARMPLSLQTEMLMVIQLKQNVRALAPEGEMATLAQVA